MNDLVKEVSGIGPHLLELNRSSLTCSAKKANNRSPRKVDRYSGFFITKHPQLCMRYFHVSS